MFHFELLGILSIFLVFVGCFVFLFFNVHYFILLLSLEMILLGATFLVMSNFGAGMELSGVFFFLLLVACMGGFSISLLVFLFRGVGKDFWVSGYFF